MKYIKIFIFMTTLMFVANCSDSTANDPEVKVVIESLIEDGNSEKDATCLAVSMKKSMPDDLWNGYTQLLTMDNDASQDFEQLGELMEFTFAAMPHIVTAASDCGVELDM